MAKGLNKTQIIGHLGRDPEMRHTAQGTAVTNFSVAVSREWKDGDGEKNEDTTWFNVVAWDKLGEICNQYLAKGSKVYVEGRIQTRKYTDRDGNERQSWELVATDMIMLDSRARDGDESRERPAPVARRNQPQPIESDADIPF
jgi:single-strand DNA-binding protein